MVAWIPWDQVQAAIEYGPGTGVFTQAIKQVLPGQSTFFAIERSPELAALVRQRCPSVTVYEDTVENVVACCQLSRVQQVDAIVCGLPWASFPETLQDRCLDAMMQVLRPGGRFVSFAYWQGLALPAAWRFRRKLDDYFQQVERSPTVWRNVPPAFVYRCVR